jgi:hypothetical protein
MHLVSLGTSFFYSSVVEISRLLSAMSSLRLEPHHRPKKFING